MRKLVLGAFLLSVAFQGSVFAGVSFDSLIPWTNDLSVTESVIDVGDGYFDLNFHVSNSSDEYIWGFAIGLDEAIDYDTAWTYGPAGWETEIISDGEESTAGETLYDELRDYADSWAADFSGFESDIKSLFQDYDHIYSAYVDVDDNGYDPIAPESSNIGFGLYASLVFPSSDVLWLTGEAGRPGSSLYRNDSNPNTPNDVVPEPASLALLGFGLLGIGLRRRR